MRLKQYRYFACDFETVVWSKPQLQDETEVWCAGGVEINQDNEPFIFLNIYEFLEHVMALSGNICCYFHNLKFDGQFIVDYLLRQGYRYNHVSDKEMFNREFKTSISEMGQWYTISIKRRGKIIEFRDSLKLLPFSLKAIGKAFNTKHQKLEMDYTEVTRANTPLTKEQKDYFINDIYVLKEALEMMFEDGHDKLTIGACCLSEFKGKYEKEEWKTLFPDLYTRELDLKIYGSKTMGEYIRRAYRGGWCYLSPRYAKQIIPIGNTYDVNSLYPSEMHSVSGNYYPIGYPKFWSGNIIPDEATINNRIYFVRFKCRFYLKKDKLPTVQIKRNMLYKGTEYLTTSKIKGKEIYIDLDGKRQQAKPTLTMTCIDYERFLKQYDVDELEILDGCYFNTRIGLFDDYINHYMEIKMNSTGAKRTEAKLFLNNLYGKMASNTDSSYKEPFLDEDGNVRYTLHIEDGKKPGYIPIGAMITAYAREFTISHAQLNYENFIYADTDSIHLVGDDVIGVEEHESALRKWKHELRWKNGKYVRQKTYIEQDIKTEEWEIKCATMKQATKDYIINKINEGKFTIDDFDIGLFVPQTQLKSKRVKGGVILYPFDFQMQE